MNSLIHQLEEFSRIIEILKEGFVPNYHGEDLRMKGTVNHRMYLGIPMVSFSDVDNTNVCNHIQDVGKEYGSYAILMKKSWALHQKWLNPIWYVSNESILQHIDLYMELFMKTEIPGFIKKYESEWKGKAYNNYCEKEWRYVIPSNEIKWIFTEEEYMKWRGDKNQKRPEPTKEMKRKALKFDIEDIEKIIVKRRSEKIKVKKFLQETHSFSGLQKNLSKEEVRRLMSLIKINPLISFPKIWKCLRLRKKDKV